MPLFDTAHNIVNNAALELGLVLSPMDDPWGVSDQNIVQLRTLLTRVGRGLVGARNWSHLQQEYTFTTDVDVVTYNMPDDFARFLHATAYNRTTSWAVTPPLSPAQWQAVQVTTTAGVTTRPFRVRGNTLSLYPTPTAPEDIAFEYITRYWVQPNDVLPVPSMDLVETGGDTVCWLDELVLVAGLKLAFLRAKSRDTTYAQAEFDEAYRSAAGGDGAAPTIRLAGSTGTGLIGPGNLPDTGYGT